MIQLAHMHGLVALVRLLVAALHRPREKLQIYAHSLTEPVERPDGDTYGPRVSAFLRGE
jgi:hypothetical protein